MIMNTVISLLILSGIGLILLIAQMIYCLNHKGEKTREQLDIYYSNIPVLMFGLSLSAALSLWGNS